MGHSGIERGKQWGRKGIKGGKVGNGGVERGYKRGE